MIPSLNAAVIGAFGKEYVSVDCPKGVFSCGLSDFDEFYGSGILASVSGDIIFAALEF
jgi:hypothetical protein